MFFHRFSSTSWCFPHVSQILCSIPPSKPFKIAMKNMWKTCEKHVKILSSLVYPQNHHGFPMRKSASEIPRLDLYGNLVDTVHQETMQRQVSSSAAHLVAAHALGATITESCIRNTLEIYDFVTQNFKRSWKSPGYVCLEMEIFDMEILWMFLMWMKWFGSFQAALFRWVRCWYQVGMIRLGRLIWP